MERTYSYEFETYESEYVEYEYTVEDDDLKDAIVSELFYRYFDIKQRLLFSVDQIISIKKALKNFTDDNDNWEKLADDFEDELKEYFRDIACKKYNERG